MKPSFFLVLGLLLGLGLAADAGEARTPSSKSREAASRPSIILLSIDDLRADHLGCYGYGKPTSPFLDKWAKKEAVLFETAYSTATSTPQAHAAMMTGMFPLSIHPREGSSGIIGNPPTLHQLFTSAGYAAHGIADAVNFSPKQGYPSSYQVEHDTGSERVFAQAREWIGKQTKPYFLFLHVYDVHWLWNPPPAFQGRLNTTPTRSGMERMRWTQALDKRTRFFDYTSLEGIVDDYDEEIMGLDEKIRRFFEFLRKQKDYATMMIVVVSDHGETFYDHGMRIGHGTLPFEELCRIPFFIKFPKKEFRGRRSSMVSLVDLMPSMLDVAGLEVPSHLEGRSLLPLVRGEDWPARPLFTRATNIGGSVSVRFGDWKFIEAPKVSRRVMQAMITRTRRKLKLGFEPPETDIVSGQADKKVSESSRKYFKFRRTKSNSKTVEHYTPEPFTHIPDSDMLFNLARDPKEQHNIIDDFPETALKARNLIAQRRALWEKNILKFRSEKPNVNEIKLSPDEIRKLKSSGYLQ